MKPTKEWEKEVIKVYDKRFYRTKAKDKMIQGSKTFGLNALDIDAVAPEEGLFNRSDNVSFAKVGIPLPTYSTGFDAFDGHINNTIIKPRMRPIV